MDNNVNWFEKRMEDIPKPIVIEDANLTEEELKKGEEDLKRFMEEAGVLGME